jgi:hypothetical protein
MDLKWKLMIRVDFNGTFPAKETGWFQDLEDYLWIF